MPAWVVTRRPSLGPDMVWPLVWGDWGLPWALQLETSRVRVVVLSRIISPHSTGIYTDIN